LPPDRVPYPFILMNANRPSEGLRYIRRHHSVVRSVIIDSGVEIFRNPLVKDYPGGHLSRLVKLYHRVKQLVGEVYVTCPDYPDDYHPRSLWLSGEITNIERTLLNIEECLCNWPSVNWLIPVQGHYRDPDSVVRAVRLLDSWGVVDRYGYFAVANLCVEKRRDVMVKTARTVRMLLPDKKIHVFGLDMPTALKLRGVIDSFDSMAWTFPRGRGGHSCKNTRERIEYFKAYLEKLNKGVKP